MFVFQLNKTGVNSVSFDVVSLRFCLYVDSNCLVFVDLHVIGQVILTRSLPIKTCIKSFQDSACLSGFDVLKKRFYLL